MAGEITTYLGVPVGYLQPANGQLLLACSGTWLGELVKGGHIPVSFPLHPSLKDAEVQAYLADREFPDPNWTILTLECFPLQEEFSSNEIQINPTATIPSCKTFPELMNQVNDNNFKNDWRQMHKEFQCPGRNDKDDTPSLRVPWTHHLLKLIRRLYDKVPVVVTSENIANKDTLICDDTSDDYVSNLVNLNCVVVTSKVVILLFDHQKYSTHDLLSYSSSLLSDGHLKQLFIVFQIVHIFKVFHDRGMVMGNVTLHDFFITNNFHIRAFPKLSTNLPSISKSDPNLEMYRKHFHDKESESLMNYVETVLQNQPSLSDPDSQSVLSRAVALWTQGRLSNLSYLLFLNYLSGRRFGHPNHHPVVPWVTDFSEQHLGWRDLTKSKFRLNKGDQQLDLTYESGKLHDSQHHVSDVLSEITYYTYKSRRTDRAVLCRTVRPNWVPGQYPSSMQRLQQWSPDEAIPEFYTDPLIFSSIHSDLPDLELPSWTSTNEEFVEWHRGKLESDEVSSSLHTWIDLTFGYKLSGSAAVRAKNVCLDLVDNHKNLRISGVVQLFTQPHPFRRPVQVCCVPPSIEEQAKDEALSSDSEEEEERSNDLLKFKFLSKSRTSLTSLQEENSRKQTDQDEILLNCPADYNPIASLLELESIHNFNTKAMSCVDYHDIASSSKEPSLLSSVEEQHVKDLKVLGCLIMELFLPKKFSCLGQISSLSSRYQVAIQVIQHEIKLIPHCIRQTVLLLLLPNLTSIKHSLEESGLPLPSADQLLDPSLSTLPFPPFFTTFLHTLAGVESTNVDINHVKLHNTGDVAKAEEKVSEFQVKLVASRLVPLMPEMSVEEFDLVLPLVKSLMSTPRTAVMASWHLLDPSASVLGPSRASEHLLQPLLALYHNSSPTSKHLKLYHRSFLITVIVRLKLQTFLTHFTNLLIEAVGGYKDVEFTGSREGLEKSWNLQQQEPVEAEPVKHCKSPTKTEPLSPSPSPIPTIQRLSCSEFEEGEVFEFDCIDEMAVTKHNNTDIPNDLIETLEKNFYKTVISPNDGKVPDSLFYVPSNLDQSKPPVAEVHPQPEPLFRRNTGNISAVAGESVMWLAHRLGPVLASRYLAKNLLRMLNLCYQGPEGCRATGDPFPNQRIRLSPGSVSGDIAAGPVLDCLAHLAGLYGDQVILVQYLPYSWDLISLCRKRVNSNLEGGLLGCLAMIHTIIPMLTDTIIMKELLEDHNLGHIVLTCLQIVTTRRLVFTGGSRPRQVLLYKLMDIIYLIGLRIGEDMARTNITTVVVALFSAFDKIYCSGGVPSTPDMQSGEGGDAVDHNDAALEELRGVLTPEVAYTAYVAFYHLLGGGHLDASLTNLDLIKSLCCQHQAKLTSTPHRPIAFSELQAVNVSKTSNSSSSFGTSGGNKIVVSSEDASASDEVALISRPCRDSGRHLRGNWLAYWEHEIGRPSGTSINFKQIRLQTWAGHVGSVRSLSVLNGENSFLSGGKDKTVRLWSLRNSGDGSGVGAPQSVYTGHRKPVFSVTYLETSGLAASCDGGVQLWDPFVGSLVHEVEAGKGGAFCVMRGLEAPTPAIAAATTDAVVRIIDTRTGSKGMHLKVSHGSSGIIRSMAVSGDGNLLAVGHSSGFISLLDLRSGRLKTGFKAHDGEVITLTNVDKKHFVSTSLDQTASGWRWEDGRLCASLRAPPEPLHCVRAHSGEVITGSTANRVTVHSEVATDAVVNVSKLRSDILKGNLMQLAVLPLNKMLLLATDTGHIHLVC